MHTESKYRKLYRELRCEKCGKLLGNFENAKGEVKCPRCKHIQKIDLKMSDE